MSNTVAKDGEIFGPVNVIEVRACKNGHVVTVFYDRGHAYDGPHIPRGYESHVVESHDPKRVGAAVTAILQKHKLDANVMIQPVRKLP